MNMTSVMIPSATLAMKAQKIFTANGYICNIKRTAEVSKNGCTIYITVNTDADKVISILNHNKIRYGEILPKAGEP